jgi:hypothetical protein
MSEETPKKRATSAANSKLPKLSAALSDQDIFDQAKSLLVEAEDVKRHKKALEQREADIKSELAAICDAYGLPGFKWGLTGFEYHGWKTKQTLSKEKLLAAGVSAETIAAAYTESKPYLSTEITLFDQE